MKVEIELIDIIDEAMQEGEDYDNPLDQQDFWNEHVMETTKITPKNRKERRRLNRRNHG